MKDFEGCWKKLAIFVGQLIVFMVPTMFYMFVGSIATSAVVQYLGLVNFEKDLVLYLVGAGVGLLISKRRIKGD